MPNGYGRGPGGFGRRNRGRGRGYGSGFGRGWGYGPGRGYGFEGGWGSPGPWGYDASFAGPWNGYAPGEERERLLDYKAYLEDELRMVEERLKEIEELGGE